MRKIYFFIILIFYLFSCSLNREDTLFELLPISKTNIYFENNLVSLVLEQAERITNNKIIFLYVTTIKYYDKDKKKASDKIACFNLKIYFN